MPARRFRHARWPFVAVLASLVAAVLVALALGGGGRPRPADVAQGAGTAEAGRAPETPARSPIAAASPDPKGRHRANATADPTDLFRGLGSWVDIYERSSFAHPERAVRRMHRHGVRTLYIETSNFARRLAVKWRPQQVRFIQAAHRYGLRIVAWYLPGFVNPRRDLARSMRAIHLRTRSGQGYDGFALDIESPAVRRPAARTRRLLQLSDRIRAAVGPDYPLGAIIPTPLGMQRNPSYWPGFPYRRLRRDYGVFVPMTYFTWRTSGARGAHAYTVACIDIIRRRVGDPSVPIHVIGGISDDSTTSEARGFVHAVRQRRVLGGSYYAFHGTTNRLWRVLHGIARGTGRSATRRR